MTSSRLPRVAILVTGGTITMAPSADGRGITPTLSGDDLVAAVPALQGVAELDVATPFLLPGASLGFGEVATLSSLAAARIADGAAGVVVVQGTDTIDETAFLLDLAHTGDAPIVVTGAMRGASTPGADGAANLLAAVTVAASPEARGLGAIVVLNDEIHAARSVVKGDTAAPDAFASPRHGALGRVLEGRCSISLRPAGARVPALIIPDPAPHIAVVKTGLGDDGTLLDLVASSGFDGCVLEGMGAGHVPAALVPRVEALARVLPVVLATRVPGPMLRATYDFPGSEIDCLSRGLIVAGGLPAQKARLLLACLCGAGAGRDAIRKFFHDHF